MPTLLARWIVLLVGLALTGAAWAQDRSTPYDLNRELLGFYTTYAERVAETVDGIQAELDDPAKRHAYQSVKVYATTSVLETVTSDDPAAQLIDLLVMLRLQTRVWADGGQAFSTPEEAERLRATFADLEATLGRIAVGVLPAELVAEVRAFADAWADENSDLRYRAFTRLQDLPDSEAKNLVKERARRGFLFRRVDDATREIERARFSAERALFLAKHMPTLVQWHSNLLLYRTLSTPEIVQVLDNLDEMTAIAGRLATTVDELPQDVADMLSANGESLAEITANVRVAAENFRVIAEVIGPVMMRQMDRGRPPLDLTVVEGIAAQIALASQELARTTTTLRDMGYDTDVVEHATTTLANTVEEVAVMLDQRIAEVDARIERQMQELFYLLVALIVIHLLGRILFFYLERRGRSRD